MAIHNEIGSWGEQIAVDILIKEGYAIVERNWKMGHLEIDIIASKDATIVFAEVKTRSDIDEDPLEAVTRAKINNMVRAAQAYITARDMPHDIRFDLFAIAGTPDEHTVEYIPDAFQPTLRTLR